MSTEGNAKNYIELRGSLSLPEAIHGKSAYEIAVMHGFDGTEEEWLYSLVEEANTIAKAYADNAGASAQRAEEAKSAAETAETNAQGSAESATESASAASASAESAESAAVRAETAAEEAETHANAASASAQNAAESEWKALAYNNESSMSARNAEYYAQTADSAGKAAATAATNAANSASEASGYAWGAKTEADRAEAAVAAMGNGAEVATAKAAEASAAAQNASTSAQTAKTNASTATTAANTATTKASEASVSASSAKSSAERADAAAATVSNEVNPRALIKQAVWYNKETDKTIKFVDVFVPPYLSYTDVEGMYNNLVYALQAHSTTGTSQTVYKSIDGGETWGEYASIPMDGAKGMWYTDFAVDHNSNAIYLLMTTDGTAGQNNKVVTYYKSSADGNFYKRSAEVNIGSKIWLSNNSFEITLNPDKSKRVAIFGEYGTTTDGTTYSLWRTTSQGTSWEKVLEIVGDNGSTRGGIRHWHTVKADPYTRHLWAAAGDTDAQCKIFRSTDGGDTWEIMFEGSQRERTCCFVFEKDCIYYGMDAKSTVDINFTKIIKIDKSKLDTDRANCREDVAVVDNCRPVYGLTRTFYPDGFIVWSQQEPGAVFTSGKYTLQFYDYGTKKMYPIARFDISDISLTLHTGFYAGARYQLLSSGNIFAKPTSSMHQDKYGYSFVSKYIKINLTH